MEINIRHYEELDSTSEEAKKMAEDNVAEGTVVIAKHQTAGKGRMGREWIAQKGMNLSMSMVLRPDMEATDIAQLTLLTGIAICDTLKEYSIETKIKWPNDILLNRKKISGILLESKLEASCVKFVVLGVGINVNNEEMEAELQQKASSLWIETGKKFDITKLAQDLLDNFRALYNTFLQTGFSPFAKEYNELCYNISQKVKCIWGNEIFEGICLRVSEKGDLIIEQENGEIQLINSGEVRVRGMEGYI